MDFYTEHEFAQASNWYCNTQPLQDDTDKITEFSPFEGFPEFAWESEVSYQSNHIYINEFKDLENFNFDFNLPLFHENFEVNNQNPLNVVFPALEHCNDKAESTGECSFAESSVKMGNGFSRFVKKEEEYVYQEQSPSPLPLSSSSTSFVRSKKSCLQYDEIKKHFDVPITLAAKRLNVGLTVLKKRCRELNITRWPHRKLKSLMLLMDNLKEMGLDNEVARLEKQKKLFETIPGMELTEETKKLRQACFKNCYKKRRLLKFQR
ncbi:protein RKD4 [Vicia villosa]|uniref:protein RKD4 n=1 Tax=Vicia villosa TaxID=3911 RepID=UPI00273AA4FF|nr:protein RKD4 [Vicia villosa]